MNTDKGTPSEPDRLVRDLVYATAKQTNFPSEKNQNAYRAARDAVESALASLPKTPEPPTVKPEAVGEECWFAWVDALVDIWQDGNDNAPDDRCYVQGALKSTMLEAKAALEAHREALASRAEPPVLEVQGEQSPLPVHPTERSGKAVQRAVDEDLAQRAPTQSEPIDMVLFCPKCGMQHVDAPGPHVADENEPSRPGGLWSNPPHKSHLCHGCGHVWRPADEPTNGVAAVKTTGKADSPLSSGARSEPLGTKALRHFLLRAQDALCSIGIGDQADPVGMARAAYQQIKADLVAFPKPACAQSEVGRFRIADGKVVEWEIDNGADERADGTYPLYTSPAAKSDLPSETALSRFVRSGPEERGGVYERVIPAAIEMQRATLLPKD